MVVILTCKFLGFAKVMSQTVVTKYYSTRKRFKDPSKSVKNIENVTISETLLDVSDKISSTNSTTVEKCKRINPVTNYFKSDAICDTSDQKNEVRKEKSSIFKKEVNAPKKKLPNESRPCTKVKSKRVNKVTNYNLESKSTSDVPNKNNKSDEKTLVNELPHTPKRNLSNPEELTPSKKKMMVAVEETTPGKLRLKSNLETPKKLNNATTRRKLDGSPQNTNSPVSIRSPSTPNKTPQKNLTSLIHESRTKILFSGKLDELKKSLEKFSQVSSKTKEFESNPYKITSVISKTSELKKQVSPIKKEEPAFKKYSYLVEPPRLTLPYKYKLLSEAFRCMDVVVSMLNNRKEKITFEKVQNGIQKMMNKNFLKRHLGQIMTVLPTAYALHYEKNDSHISRISNDPYVLILTPNLSDSNGGDPVFKTCKNTKSSQNFVQMTPQHLLQRKNMFIKHLTEIVKTHHKNFLNKLNLSVPNKNILRWHPKFAVDSVPDVPAAELPEEPETKISTAKDVLNKIRGSVRGKVEKALKSVADNQMSEVIKNPDADSKNCCKKENSALKGICTDLLEKIRARESAKLLETITRSPTEEKRLAMLERIPKIAHILWHYFIAERKAAVAVDAAVEKIIHSCNSLTTPEEVKEHLELITETMPQWLSFIKISKGEYITMDKRKDLNEMLSNLK